MIAFIKNAFYRIKLLHKEIKSTLKLKHNKSITQILLLDKLNKKAALIIFVTAVLLGFILEHFKIVTPSDSAITYLISMIPIIIPLPLLLLASAIMFIIFSTIAAKYQLIAENTSDKLTRLMQKWVLLTIYYLFIFFIAVFNSMIGALLFRYNANLLQSILLMTRYNFILWLALFDVVGFYIFLKYILEAFYTANLGNLRKNT
jgi:hypothetical protein